MPTPTVMNSHLLDARLDADPSEVVVEMFGAMAGAGGDGRWDALDQQDGGP